MFSVKLEWNQKIKREFCHFRLELFKLHTLLDNGNELKTNKFFLFQKRQKRSGRWTGKWCQVMENLMKNGKRKKKEKFNQVD